MATLQSPNNLASICLIARNNIKNYLGLRPPPRPPPPPLPPPPPPPQASVYKNTFNRTIKRSTKIMLVFILSATIFGPTYRLYLCQCPDSNCPTGGVHAVYVMYPSSVSAG